MAFSAGACPRHRSDLPPRSLRSAGNEPVARQSSEKSRASPVVPARHCFRQTADEMSLEAEAIVDAVVDPLQSAAPVVTAMPA